MVTTLSIVLPEEYYGNKIRYYVTRRIFGDIIQYCVTRRLLLLQHSVLCYLKNSMVKTFSIVLPEEDYNYKNVMATTFSIV